MGKTVKMYIRVREYNYTQGDGKAAQIFDWSFNLMSFVYQVSMATEWVIGGISE